MDQSLIFIVAVFVLAGVIKGVIGLGLPTISMGLLAVLMPPVEAAAMLIIPSLVTNVWQMVAIPKLAACLRRLWIMMIAVCAGTFAGMGLMTGPGARYATAALGFALVIYGILGLGKFRFSVPTHMERWLSAPIGAITGLISAGTGVFAIPAVPYLQAIGLEKEQLIQALGLSFTVSTLALAVNLSVAGALNVSMAGTTLFALVAALAGMWVGQWLRMRLSQDAFRMWFFVGLIALGAYLFLRTVLR